MPKNYKNCSKNLKKDFRLWKKSETFYFLNGIIDYGSLCIDYESLLKTVGQLLLIRSIYRIRSQGTQRLWMSSEFKSGEGSEFWLDRILMGIHEEFPWLKNRGKTIPENLLVFPEKKGYGLALLKTWWVFCSHTMESTVRARNIFYANRSIFYSNRKLFFRPP